MLEVRKSQERGHAHHGWLESFHTFSFAGYYDPRFTGFRNLLVINEDRVAGGQGFGTHGHRDMEIISYVVGGALEHKDSMGNGSVMRAGDVQRMSAGTGVTHSEYNHSKNDPVHFLQIWIHPSATGQKPGYEQKNFSEEDKRNRLRLIVSPDGREGSLSHGQDTHLYASKLDENSTVTLPLNEGRFAWVQVIEGNLRVNGTKLNKGDGAALAMEKELEFSGGKGGAHFLVFDLN